MLKPGDRFERYVIEGVIGQGGMGTVYRASDEKLGRRVAVKVLTPEAADGQARARLLREARAAAALDHPNAVAVFDVGDAEGAPFVVMELVEGSTLRSQIGAGGELPASIARLADIGRALAGAHRRGIVHRDVKPENVMVRSDGVVKVVDFGIARRSSARVDPTAPTETPAVGTLTIDGAKLGTPVYMSPEQIRGAPLDGRADQFSWGVVAYELLTGKLPWRGDDALAAMASALVDPADRAPLEEADVPAAVQQVVLRALEKDPARRFASMEDAVAALEAAARGEAPPAAPAGVTAAQRFSTGEVREVMAKAIERDAAARSGQLGFDDLVAIAGELGIDVDALRAESRALRAQKRSAGDLEERQAWLRRRLLALKRHAGVYFIVNAAILIFGLVLLSMTPWWIWVLPALGWGIGLAIHALVALTSSEEDWAEEKRGLAYWEEERRRRHEERMASAHGRRIAPPTSRGRRKLRVEDDEAVVGDAVEAEEEAAEEERAARRR
jgi:serine/threonine-protein kinase